MKSGFDSGHGDCSHNDSYEDYIVGYKHYIDGYKHHLNGYRYKDDCGCDAGYVLGDRDSTESVLGDGGYNEDYDMEMRSVETEPVNPVYGNGVYKNKGYDNEKSSKPYREVYKKETRRNVICTNGAHSKIYNNHREPETKSGGYVKNDFYMPHRTGTHSHRPTTTSDDQMNTRPRQLDLTKETDCSKLCRGACEMSPKQRQRMASQSMDYGRQNFGFS